MPSDDEAQVMVRQAIDHERLRFARELHDVLGHTLCAIALKGELARTVLRTRPEAAERELLEILRMVRDAHGEIREVVAGYREVSLKAELEGVRAVLCSAEISSTVDVYGMESVPEAALAPLAYALREGVTNVLRHAHATWCRITLGREDGAWRLRMVNNGVGADAPADPPGNGLRGLRERLAAAHGRLRSRVLDEGRYELVVHVPDA